MSSPPKVTMLWMSFVVVAAYHDIGTRGARHLIHARLGDDGGRVTMTLQAHSTLS